MKLKIGSNTGFEIRKDKYSYQKYSKFSVMYLSDFHFNRFSSAICSQLIRSIQALNPTIILLGGDYVDTRQGLIYLDRLFFYLGQRKNVFAISGNHDRFLGQRRIKKIAGNHRIQWLEGSSVLCKIDEISIEITDSIKSHPQAEFRILCLHKPVSIGHAKFNLVFAGHLHGGQFVLWRNKKGLFPGRFFYRWNILKTTFKNCHYFVSKGLGDTLPIRYNCRKDIIFLEVN